MSFRARNLGEQSKNLCCQNKLLLLDHLDENISRLAAYEDATFERILSMEDTRLQEKKREFIREWKLRQRGCRDRQVCKAKIEEAALHKENKALDEREKGFVEQSSWNLNGNVSEAVHKDVVFFVGPALWCARFVIRARLGMLMFGLLIVALILSIITWVSVLRSGPEWLSCSLTLKDPSNEWWMD